MTAKDQLLAAYRQWAQWTHAEATAVREERWADLSQYQQAKLTLQPLINDLTDKARAEHRNAGLDAAIFDREIRPVIHELIALEAANDSALALSRENSRCRTAGLHSAQRTLHRVQRSYAPARRAAWQSYS